MKRTLLCWLLSAGFLPAAHQERKPEEIVAEQRKQAEEQWNKLLAGKLAVKQETEHFLLFGSGDEKELGEIGKAAEKAFPQIKKTAQVGAKDDLWPGKLVMHVFAERSQHRTFVGSVEKRTLEKSESATYTNAKDMSWVTVGPPSTARRYPAEIEVVQQLAAATLTRKKSGRLQEWFVAGFARSTAWRYAPSQFGEERREAARLVLQGKKTAKEIWSGGLSEQEGRVLAASFVDYLANGPGVKHFPALLDALGEKTPFEDALKNAKLNPDLVDRNWRVWAAKQGK